MKVTSKQLPKSEFLLTIEAEKGDLDKYREQACKEISQNMRVKGFRPGHVPYDVLVQQVGKEYIEMMAQEKASSKLYAEAVVAENLRPLATADFKVLEQDPYKFEIKIAVLPEVTIKDLEKIQIKKKAVKVDKKEIDQVIDEVKKERSTWEDVDRKTAKGDRVEISFEGSDPKTKEPIPNTKSGRHPVVIGDGMMVPGFEDKLEGLKKDEENEFEVTFPKDYHAENMKGKKVKFKIQILRIEERIEPKVDEDFIKSVAGKKMTEKEFRDEIEANLEHEQVHREVKRQEEEFLKELKKAAKIEVSDILIEREIDNLVQDHKENAAKYKMDWETYLKANKKTEEEFRNNLKENAQERLISSLIVDKALQMENIQIEDSEVEAYIAGYLATLPKKEQNTAAKEYKKGGARYRSVKYNMQIKEMFSRHTEGYDHNCK